MTATVTGNEVQIGQTIKDRGRWYTVTEFRKEDLGNRVRLAVTRLAGGGEEWLAILDELVYPLKPAKGAAAVLVTISNYTDHDKDVTYQVRYVRREYGGWKVVRADNGRELGWLTRDSKGNWQAHVTPSAYCGDSIDDTGDILDRVPGFLFNGTGDDQITCPPLFERTANRDEAAEVLVRYLHNNFATALGFGRHHRVTRWADR